MERHILYLEHPTEQPAGELVELASPGDDIIGFVDFWAGRGWSVERLAIVRDTPETGSGPLWPRWQP